jgi:hypothetical protein
MARANPEGNGKGNSDGDGNGKGYGNGDGNGKLKETTCNAVISCEH